jgi:hypothetical protein
MNQNDKDELAISALICMALTEYMAEPTPEQIEEFLNDATPITPEEREMMEKLGNELPFKIKEWKAKDEGCLVVEDERGEDRRCRNRDSEEVH